MILYKGVLKSSRTDKDWNIQEPIFEQFSTYGESFPIFSAFGTRRNQKNHLSFFFLEFLYLFLYFYICLIDLFNWNLRRTTYYTYCV